MRLCLIVAGLLVGIAPIQVQAIVAVDEQVMQQGQFLKLDCRPDAKDPDYDACACDADIRYPQLRGGADPLIEAKANEWFKEQAGKTLCEGNKTASSTASAKNAKAHSSISIHYETTFASDTIMAFKFTDWGYTGGAHGNGTVAGVILDTNTGKFLTSKTIFTDKNINAVNEAIYTFLASKPEEEIFRDQIEARHGKFIRDDECQGCTLILTPQGVHVLFQTYEVAPYGAGNADVPIPEKYIDNRNVLQALAKQKQLKVK